jgi:hypothetical protein
MQFNPGDLVRFKLAPTPWHTKIYKVITKAKDTLIYLLRDSEKNDHWVHANSLEEVFKI